MRCSWAVASIALILSTAATSFADLKGYWSFNDGAGSTLTDNSGLGNNGTLVSAANWQPGQTARPGDFSFNSTGGYFNLGNQPAFQNTGSQTISMWLQPSATIQSDVGFAGNSRQNPWNKSYAGEGTITLESGGQPAFYYGNNPTGNDGGPLMAYGSPVLVAPGPNWTHIVAVRNLVSGPGDTLSWYINGVFTGSTTASFDPATTGTQPLLIGSGYEGNFFGKLDDTALWNEALPAGEIAALYKANIQTAAPMYTNNINPADMDKLFQVWEDGGSSTAEVKGMLWKYVSNYNTSGHSVGDSWSFTNSQSTGIFLFLNAANNSGVLFESIFLTPEPTSMALMGLGLAGCGLVMYRRHRARR